MSGASRIAGQGIGAAVLRKEDDRFLRGRGRYVADRPIAGTKAVAFVRSTVAHGRLRGVAVPPEHRDAVFTAADMADVKPIRTAMSLKGFKPSNEPILATDKVRYVGELVAMCVAETRAEAEDIAARVHLDIEELPAIADIAAARAPGAALVHEAWGDNVFVEFMVDGAIYAIARTAAITVTREIVTARHCMVPIEGRGIVAFHDHQLDVLTVHSTQQFPHLSQTDIADCLGLPDGAVRVISPDVGGGFGYKGLLMREEVALGWLARRTGEEVRWIEDFREHLAGNANCREHTYRVTGYADASGRLLGLECTASVDSGAYSVYPTSAALEAGQIAGLMPGPYCMEAYRCEASAVATNKCPILPYRGVARPNVCLAVEAVMDGIAHEAGIEPHEARVRSLVPPEAMPFTNITGKVFDSGDYPQCLRRAVYAIDWPAWRERQQRGEADGRRIGIGLSFFNEQGTMGTAVMAGWGRPVVPGFEQAGVRLTADGCLEIRVGTHSHGQAHETTFAQLAHAVLGLPLERIRFFQGDTLFTPFSTGTWGSRGIVMGGGAVVTACRQIAERAKIVGAHLMQADPSSVSVEGGCVVGEGARVTLAEVARTFYLQPQNLPPGFDPGGLDVTAGYKTGSDVGTFSYAAHAVALALDAETGAIELLDYVVVEDGGTLVNPLVVDGQVCGGTVQGIGQALYEQTPFDERGQPLAVTLADYLLPAAGEMPNIRIFHMETPSPHTEFGMKGIGEGGAVGPPAAILNAVNDALCPLGAAVWELPITPARVRAAIEEAMRPRDATG